MSEKNKSSWNEGAEKYSAYHHSQEQIDRIIRQPTAAFHHTTWQLIHEYVPDLRGKRICVPSSGDNHAVFAFALLGAKVTSCDIAENQLSNARRVADQYEWGDAIEFICADTMKLEGIADDCYDFVYTSNGVHVWIDDLNAMYRNIYRVTKPNGAYIMYEIHPFQRPFNDDASIVKPYDAVGPYESDSEITFAWRVMDIVNALCGSGFAIQRVEEMFAEKDYDWPFWISLEDRLNGVTAAREEVDRMHDWRKNPMAALPNWIGIAAKKPCP